MSQVGFVGPCILAAHVGHYLLRIDTLSFSNGEEKVMRRVPTPNLSGTPPSRLSRREQPWEMTIRTQNPSFRTNYMIPMPIGSLQFHVGRTFILFKWGDSEFQIIDLMGPIQSKIIWLEDATI